MCTYVYTVHVNTFFRYVDNVCIHFDVSQNVPNRLDKKT